MDDPEAQTPGTMRISFRTLRGGEAHPFRIEPDAETRAGMAETLGLIAVKKLRLEGKLTPEEAQDWRLEAMLGATVVQPCVATLDPVTTRIDAPVLRRYLADMPDMPEGDEIEMPEDESAEPLPSEIELLALTIEALALNVPDYPRSADAEAIETVFAAPGVTPMSDEEAKPFAGLAALRDKLEK